MERVKRGINSRVIGNKKVSTKSIIISAVLSMPSACVSLVLVFAAINIFSSASLYASARNNEVLRQQLVALQKENSSLEEKKANLVNIREIQQKAESMGFVHNTTINYVK